MLIDIQKLKFPFLLLVVCLIAYLPLSSFLFALKNDAFAYNFPNKYFFSEALRKGYIPTWNPYLNYGFPLYADPGFAWWNPITWFFGLIGYNVYIFSIEILLYIYIAGLGMYWLCRKLNLSPFTSFAIGCMFMCSGFFIGNLQHINFITCTAFLPWLVGSWINFQHKANIKTAFFFSIAAYLLCTGGHPAIPVASAFFIFLLTILYFINFHSSINTKTFILNQFKILILTLILLLPLLLSYLQILPYYSRTGSVDHSASADTGFTFPSFISLLYPFATIRNYNLFMTDVSMRNIYFTIPGLLFFISFLLNKQKQKIQIKIQIIFFIAGLVMLILAMGGKIKEVLYDHLPLFSWIRTNGEFRVFLIFSFLICAAFEIEKAFDGKKTNTVLFRKLMLIVLIVSTLLLILLLFFRPWFNFHLVESSFINSLKNFLDSMDFNQTLFISVCVTTLLAACYFFIRNNSKKVFLIILLADVVLSCWLLLPITGVGKTSVSGIQKIINKSPEGFPSPLTTSSASEPLSEEEKALIVNWQWYNKKINHTPIDYPSQLKSTQRFLESKDTAAVLNKPFIFLTSGNSQGSEVSRFSPSGFVINIQKTQRDTLVVLQNWFPGWNAYLNGKKVPIEKYKENFIAVPVSEETKLIQFEFSAFKF